MISKTRGHEYKLLKNHCSVHLTKYYFTNRVIDHWNSLPSDIVKVPSAVAFKKCLLRMYILHNLVLVVFVSLLLFFSIRFFVTFARIVLTC